MLRISQTGIRSGEIITSSQSGNQNKGSIIQIRGFYPPSLHYVSNLDPILLRDGFNQFGFFANMTVEERLKWLIDNGTNNQDLYMEDVPIALKFIKVGGTFFTKALSPDQLNMLMRGNPNDSEGYWPILEVYNLFPRKPNSKARKHTLIFRPNNWSLMPDENITASFDGIYVDLDTLTLKSGHLEKPVDGYLRSFKVERLKSLISGFAVTQSRLRTIPLTWEILIGLSVQASGIETIAQDMNKIRELLNWFPPGLFKSLIQKLIRTRCERVEYLGVEYPVIPFLLTTIGMLMLHAGAFVPNIQRFVTGMESAAKRLAVSICEDAYLEDGRYLLSMYAAAAVAQQDRSWQPTDELIMHWMRAAILAQKDPRMYDYDWKSRTDDVSGITEWSPLAFSYLLLAEIKSFESDIQMVGSIAERKGVPRNYTAVSEPFKVMPLIHCLDQHTFTEIALYMAPPQPLLTSGGVFKPIFGKIWEKVVGVNPRNVRYENWRADDADVIEIRNAQRQVWISKISKPQQRPLPLLSEVKVATEEQKIEQAMKELKIADKQTVYTLEHTLTEPTVLKSKTFSFKYTLDESWLAGLIGPIEIKLGHINTIVVVRCDDIYSFTAIKRPSRDTKSAAELTEEEKSAAIARIKVILENGFHLTHVPSTLPVLKDATVYYRESIDEPPTYYLRLSNGEIKKWNDFVKMNFEFPIYPRFTPSIDEALLYTGEGIMEGADEIFDYLLKNTSRTILNRLATYLEGNKSDISIFKISRDGTGVDYAVIPEDVSVNVFLCYLCCLYPAALVKISSGFKVKCGPLLWSLRDRLYLSLRAPLKVQVPWPIPVPDGRQLWEHQKDILATMIAKHEKGKKGHEIWATVGSGKSLALTSYMNYLIRKGEMPQYCVYTLPPSAVNAIVRELEMMKIPYQIMDMRSGSITQTILPAMVNLVWHDHMRMNGLDVQMNNLASEMFFVVDEFHKTMNKTIRTSIALEIVRLSAEFVAMSGTIIKDTNSEDLIQWLSQVVEFEVTEHNYFTALSALISKKVQTNIVVERVLVEAKLIDEKYYYSLVPKSLGGTSDTLHFRQALAECYKSITLEMVRQAILYIQAGEKLFMVAKDFSHQIELENLLHQQGVTNIFLITSNTSIVLTPLDNSPITVVITTIKQAEGYTLTDRRIGISCVSLSNQSTRDQIDGRLNRIGQFSPIIRLITVHAGILSYIMRRYETARSLAEAIRGFADDIGLEDRRQITQLM